jgi:cytokinin dehydrogenase
VPRLRDGYVRGKRAEAIVPKGVCHALDVRRHAGTGRLSLRGQDMIGRRKFLGAAAAAAVVGFDPLGRTWVTAAEAAECPSFAGAPPLEGELAVDEASREAVATDLGNIIVHKPCAVLRPRSANDIAAMIRFCRANKIPVSTRGQAHSTHGQGLSTGLLIENRHLNRIHSLRPDSAEVDTGIKWMDLVKAAFEKKLTPPVLTGYTGLSVGGTLSMGGVGGIVGGLHTGLQVDHVRELEVVTGTGAIERCSRHRKPDLFNAALGGLGQCGVITKAVIELVPAKERARTYVLSYTDNATFFRDLNKLIERPAVDHVYCEVYPPGSEATHKTFATVFYGPSAAPDDKAIVGDMSTTPAIDDVAYLDYVFSIDTLIDGLRESVGWDRLIKPWYDVWLPGGAMEKYVGEVQPTLTQRDIGTYGASLIYPQRRARVTRPLPPLPKPDGSQWVYILDINTVANTPGHDPAFIKEMLDRNNRLFARARDHYGAVLYPIGSVPFTERDWRNHYGDKWHAFRAAKTRYDPSGVLTPGPGIFGPR